jgi:hypothetical protein
MKEPALVHLHGGRDECGPYLGFMAFRRVLWAAADAMNAVPTSVSWPSGVVASCGRDEYGPDGALHPGCKKMKRPLP